MNPTFLDSMSWEMAEVYGAITDQIIINLARHFPFYVADNVPTSAFAYQTQMLAQMGQISKETIQIIRNNLDGVDDALKSVLEQSIIDAVRTTEPALFEAAKKGALSPAGIPVVAPNQMRAFQLYYQQSAEKLNLVNTVMLESTKSAYQQAVSDVVSEIGLADRINRTQLALDTATGEVVTGVSSWNTALRHATDKMANGGIVGFIDHGGHRWSAEAYTAMDIRTTVFNTARAAVWEENENFGNDLYMVSYHNGARPLCYPYQNKVISSINAARTVQDIDGNTIEVLAQSATSYGEAAGLFGINCKHYPTPFIPGVSIIRGQPQNEEENNRVYEESQEQRRLERKLREEKRDVMMAKAQGRPQEEIDALREKARSTSQDIDDFCQSTGRQRRRNREGVYTKREFPDADKYDVGKFETEQRDRISEYFSNGGAQQGRTFGQMTPNQPVVPPTPATPVAQNVVSQTTQSTANVVQSVPTKSVTNVKDFAEFKTYMRDNYGIDVTSGVKKLDFDLVKQAVSGFESVAKDFPEVAKGINKIRLSKSGVMSCTGTEITFNSDYFTNPAVLQKSIDRCVKSGWWPPNTTAASIGAHETGHGVEAVLIRTSGKYATRIDQVFAWNYSYEARDIVNEAVSNVMATSYGQGKTRDQLINAISSYATKNNAETMAEAFADVNANAVNANPLSQEIYKVTQKKYADYLKGSAP